MVMICGLLDIHPTVIQTTIYALSVENDYRFIINPRHPLSEEQLMSRPYYQVFREKYGFIPNLSIVDLLFNMGSETSLFL